MVREVRAKYSNGVLTPFEELDLVEGDEVIITVKEIGAKTEKADMLERTAGGCRRGARRFQEEPKNRKS